MDTKTKNIVEDFLFEKLSPDLIIGLDLVSKLKFPINDKKSFEALLAKKNKSISEKHLKHIFRPGDFPIVTLRNGLEKIHGRFIDSKYRIPVPSDWSPTPWELPEDIVQVPSACEVYHRDFEENAANCGCQKYGEALRAGDNHLQATLQGIGAARHFRDHGVCGPHHERETE